MAARLRFSGKSNWVAGMAYLGVKCACVCRVDGRFCSWSFFFFRGVFFSSFFFFVELFKEKTCFSSAIQLARQNGGKKIDIFFQDIFIFLIRFSLFTICFFYHFFSCINFFICFYYYFLSILFKCVKICSPHPKWTHVSVINKYTSVCKVIHLILTKNILLHPRPE